MVVRRVTARLYKVNGINYTMTYVLRKLQTSTDLA